MGKFRVADGTLDWTGVCSHDDQAHVLTGLLWRLRAQGEAPAAESPIWFNEGLWSGQELSREQSVEVSALVWPEVSVADWSAVATGDPAI